MKYFTLDRWISDQDIETVDMEIVRQTRKRYEDYFVSIADKLPPALVRLHQTIRLHDANLRDLELDVEQKHAVLIVDTYPVDADAVLHCRTIALRYEQVNSLQSAAHPQKHLADLGGYGDIGGDEVELLAEGNFEHRFVFSSGIELSVRFGNFYFSDVEVAV